MAKVIPFRGTRYNRERVGDFAAVVTPPYDVINEVAQKKYYEKHPYNIIRLELGYQFPTDNEENNCYLRATRDYQSWLAEGILRREEKNAIYLYEQEFSVTRKTYKRTGFFARVCLEDYHTGNILPHEETLTKPKADRLALMHACQANFSPVFALYEDPNMILDEVFQETKKKLLPDVELIDEVGERHLLWIITDQEIHKIITKVLASKVLYIADGHHRYETALAFYQENKEKYPGAVYVLMCLVNSYDPGLVILPTYRIVHSLKDFDLSLFKARLAKNFLIKKIASSTFNNLKKILNEYQEKGQNAFIMGTKEPATYLLTLQHPEKVQELVPHRSKAWCNLDVAALHVLVFQELLGIGSEKITHQENLTYTRDEGEALAALLKGESQLVFLLNPPKIGQVIAVARAGDKMPQKSTYFYPKLLTGLVLNDLTS